MSKLFEQRISLRTRLDVASNDLTTFKLGAGAKSLYEPENIYSLIALLNEHSEYKLIGNGSNIVLPDQQIQLPLIRLAKNFSSFYNVNAFPKDLTKFSFETINLNSVDSGLVLAFGSTSLMKLSSHYSNLGYTGIEFAAGIPASISGAAYMNAGAHGAEMSKIIECVYVISENAKLERLSAKELKFSYRKSNIERPIVAVGLKLSKLDIDSTKNKRRECLEYRKKTQPLTVPSAGSVFKNITKDDKTLYAARMIESVDLKGVRVGGVEFSNLHANWLVKISNEARSNDFTKLVDMAKDLVEKKYGVKMHTEIILW